MADLLDRFPLAGETPETILARLQADLNAGIDPTDPLYADMQPGSVWDDLARAFSLELDRLYDRMLTEIPAAALPATATGQWLDAWADAVGLQRKDAVSATGVVRFTGADGIAVPTGTQVSTEAPTADADPITFQATEGGTISGGFIDLPVQAVEEGSQGNVSANSITLLDSVLPGGSVSVTNPAPITGGDDIESDERLQARVMRKLRGTTGGGNIDYYVNLALNYPGVGFVTVLPNTPGLGDVRVVITDVNNDPVSAAMVAGLQALLDPAIAPTQGAGEATIGAEVTVATPTTLAVTVDAEIVAEAGYSITGESGTQALASTIEKALHGYIDPLPVGGDVIRNKVLAAIIDVDGVVDVTAVTLNGAATDLAVSNTQVAALVDVNLST